MDAIVEPLECRRLLAGHGPIGPASLATAREAPPVVDLGGRIVCQPLNELLVTRHSGAHATASVRVFNSGNAPAVGALMIALHISPGSTFVEGLPVVGSAKIGRVKLHAGGSQVFQIGFAVRAGTPPGGYHLFGVIRGMHGIVESNLSNNVAGSVAPIAVTNRRIVGAGPHHHSPQPYWCNTDESGFDIADQALLATGAAVIGGSELASPGSDQSDSSAAASQPTTFPSTDPTDSSGGSSGGGGDSSSDSSSDSNND